MTRRSGSIPRMRSPTIARSAAWSAKQEYDQADADLAEAARLAPDNPVTYNGRAWMWATCPNAKYRDGRKAVESATKACELTDWDEAGIIDTLAAAYAELGDFAVGPQVADQGDRARNRREG